MTARQTHPIAHWIKKHWHLMRLLPWGDLWWDLADEMIDDWHTSQGRPV